MLRPGARGEWVLVVAIIFGVTEKRFVTVGTCVAVVLLTACSTPQPRIHAYSGSTCLVPGGDGPRQEIYSELPPSLRLGRAGVETQGRTAVVTLTFEGNALQAGGRGTIEVYFDSPSEKTVQSRALIATFGGHTQFGLDETDPAGVFVRTVRDENFDFERVAPATLIASGKKVRLEGDLGIADATPNLIVLRYASEEVFQKRPDFRFTSDGIATVVYFRGDEIHSRPLPRLPNR